MSNKTVIKLSNKIPEINSKKIRDYLCSDDRTGSTIFIPRGATNVRVYKLSKWRQSVNDVHTFSVSYLHKGVNQTLDLVLKLYPDDEKRCQKEYKILKALERVKFPVPYVFVREMEEKIFGAPFVVMEKVKGKPLRDGIKHLDEEEIRNIIRCFVETLVHLHELKWEEMGIDFLNPPKNKYDYAKKQALWEDELPDYVDKTGFEWGTNWLKINAKKHPCDQYSLIRNDMNLKNFLITREGKIVMLDWEWAEIGDALKDVGYAYHNIRHAFGVKNINKKGVRLALYFLKQYIRSSSKKINLSALRFHLFSAGLREAIYLRYMSGKTKHPSFIRKNFGAAYIPFFPFIWWHYRSRYKHLERFLRREAMDYEQAMFETAGGKILSRMEKEDVSRFLEAKPSELILDVGTGSGRIARGIVSETRANVIAIDAERLAIQSAKKRIRNLTGYEMVIADGQYLPFKNSCFDGIICIRTLKYFPDYILGISEMVRVLKSGGRLVVDLSSVLGYETILRYISHAISARGSHVFNFYKMKNLLRNQKLFVVNSVPLQKIPHKMWNLSANPKILQLFTMSEYVLRKIPPSMFSRSILFKCVKD